MEKIDLAILIGTVFTLLLLLTSLGIILFAQKKKSEALLKLQSLELEQEKKFAQIALQSFEEERQRIGMELHDDLGQQLTLNTMHLKNLANLQDLGPIIQSMQDAVSKCSNISRLMYPVVLNKFGLKTGLEQLIDSVGESNTMDIQHTIAAIEMPYDDELTLFRIVQELLNNSLKHSKCTTISIDLIERDSFKTLIYNDNGIGFDLSDNSLGLGLHSIKTRALSLTDRFEFISSPNHGFTFQLTL
jgi:two-component system NarL family sensor kinase